MKPIVPSLVFFFKLPAMRVKTHLDGCQAEHLWHLSGFALPSGANNPRSQYGAQEIVTDQ